MPEGSPSSAFFTVAPVAEVLDALAWVRPREAEEVPLAAALGRVLAAGVTAGTAVPHFRRSAMDGYAVRASDTFGCTEGQPAYLSLEGVVEMGRPAEGSLGRGAARRISTGGMIPPEGDAVVMWEYTRESDGLVEIFRPAAPGDHVIEAGEDVRAGETVLTAGRKIRPADIGLLSGLGHPAVAVRRRPRVAVVSTGDELVEPEMEPAPGQVRNINQASLGAWITLCGGEPLLLGLAPDRLEEIRRLVEAGLDAADLVLISGGSSAGTRDLTRAVVKGLGDPGLLFHGIALRPGKPTVVGARGETPVFGLPGHPVSAMVVFLALVRPVLNRMLGMGELEGTLRVPARLSDNLPSRAGREDYFQVSLRLRDGELEAAPVFRKSGLVTAAVRGDAMVRVPAACEGLEAGETVLAEIFR